MPCVVLHAPLFPNIFLCCYSCVVVIPRYEVVFSKWEKAHEEMVVDKNPHRAHGDSCARVLDTLQTVALMGLANLVRDSKRLRVRFALRFA